MSLCSEEDKKASRYDSFKPAKIQNSSPIDHIVADNPNGEAEYSSSLDINDDKMGLDIGESTITLFKELEEAKTIFWNGPMGFLKMNSLQKGHLKRPSTLKQ